MVTKLQDVFGISKTVRQHSYVDRGRLDERFAYALNVERHVSIHGDSKQGKSWLRRHGLAETQTIVVQCGVDTTADALFAQALGQLGVALPGRLTLSAESENSVDITAGVEGKVPLVAKASADAEVASSHKAGSTSETHPVGQGMADLSWVAKTIVDSGKRLVIEDFHYVSEKRRRDIAFLLKALVDYGLFAVVAGIWPQDLDLLVYHNGDLDGRVEDIFLRWSDEELDLVLRRGGNALNLEVAPEIRGAMVQDATGNVGLMQRLAESLCLKAGITEAVPSFLTISSQEHLEAARAAVSASMAGRYGAFTDNFVRGMRRYSDGLEVYRHILRVVSAASDQELLEGIDSAELLRRVTETTDKSVRGSDLTQALDRLDRLQSKIDVNPPVLAYNGSARKVFLVDRSFLFYRKYADPKWPWDEEVEPDAVQIPLNLDD